MISANIRDQITVNKMCAFVSTFVNVSPRQSRKHLIISCWNKLATFRKLSAEARCTDYSCESFSHTVMLQPISGSLNAAYDPSLSHLSVWVVVTESSQEEAWLVVGREGEEQLCLLTKWCWSDLNVASGQHRHASHRLVNTAIKQLACACAELVFIINFS